MARIVVACIAYAVLLGAGALSGQVMVRNDQPPLPIDAAASNDVIDKVVKALDETYVFPEVAAKMGDGVRRHRESGDYANVETGQKLAELLTKHLQEVSKDKHLRVRCSTEKLPTRREGGPTPEMLARMKQMAVKSNAGFRKVERLAGNVGYVEFDRFMDTDDIAGPAAAAMTFLANTDALVIDLRQNGGGSPRGVQVVCSYLFGADPVHLNSLYWRKGDRTEEFWTLKDLPAPRYLGKPVYVLTSSNTFSGAEECAYNLQTRKRATVVGETTGGGAHPGGGVRVGDHFVVFIPSGRAINPVTKTNWEGTGVKPDVKVPADKALKEAHTLAVKGLLEKAPDEEARRQIRDEVERAKRHREPAPEL
jgi:C-terminal processing protease CtpA/Prc